MACFMEKSLRKTNEKWHETWKYLAWKKYLNVYKEYTNKIDENIIL